MAKTPKLPKQKKSLKDRFKTAAKQRAAKTLTNNFGVAGRAIAKHYLTPTKPKATKETKVEKATTKDIKKKPISNSHPTAEVIDESTKQLTGAFETLALNISRETGQVTKQVDIFGEEVTKSIEELNRVLTRMGQPQKVVQAVDQTKGATHSTSKVDTEGGGLLDNLKLGVGGLGLGLIGRLFRFGTGMAIAGALDSLFPEGEKSFNDTLKKHAPGLAEKDEDVGSVNRFINKYLGAGAVHDWLFGKDEKNKQQLDAIKIKYEAKTLTIKAKNSIEFKTKYVHRGVMPRSVGTLNRMFDSLTGGPGGPGFFNRMGDALIGGRGGSGSLNGMADGALGTGGGDGKGGYGGGKPANNAPEAKPEPGSFKDRYAGLNDGKPQAQSGGRPGFFHPTTATAGGQVGDARNPYPGSPNHHVHQGVDFTAKQGTPIVAAGDGVVKRVWTSDGAAGNAVEIEHPDGTTTRYFHMHEHDPNLKPGMKVIGGQTPLGTVGGTGPGGKEMYGSHLHFEARDKNGKLINPNDLFGLQGRGSKIEAGTPVGVPKQNDGLDAEKLKAFGEKQIEPNTPLQFGNITRRDNFIHSGVDDYQPSAHSKFSDLARPHGYDTQDGEARFQDRRKDPNPFDDDQYSVHQMEMDAYKRQYTPAYAPIAGPSPLGYALGAKTIVNQYRPDAVNAMGNMEDAVEMLEDKKQWDSYEKLHGSFIDTNPMYNKGGGYLNKLSSEDLNGPAPQPPQQSRPDNPSQPSQSFSKYQSTDKDDLDHRPDRNKGQDFQQLLGVSPSQEGS